MLERRRSGFSLVEAIVVSAMLGLLLMLALPDYLRARARANVGAARDAFIATHSLAQRIAAQYGRVARLHLDPEANRFWVSVDTGFATPGPSLATILPVVSTQQRFAGVRIEAPTRTFCFDPRGLPTARHDCSLPNATIVFRLGSISQTLTLSRLGRVVRR